MLSSPKTKSCQHGHVKGVSDPEMPEVASNNSESTQDVELEVAEQSSVEYDYTMHSLDTAGVAVDEVIDLSFSEKHSTRTP